MGAREWGLGTGDWGLTADSGHPIADSLDWGIANREPSAALSAGGLLPDIFFIKEHTDNDRQEGSCRCGHAHGVKGGWEEEGGGIGAGDADSENGNHVVNEGEGRFPAGCKIAGEAEVDTGNGAVHHIGLEVVVPHGNDGGFSRYEEGYDFRGFEVDKEDAEKAEGDTDGNAIAEGLSASFCQTGAQVLGGRSRYSGHHGRGHQEEEADNLFYDANSRCGFHAAAVGDGGDNKEGYLNEDVLAGNGNADGKDAAGPFFSGKKGAAVQGKGCQLPIEVDEGKDHAHHFTGKGAPGSAGGAHVEGADEKVIQKNVDYAGNGNEGHGGFCVSHASEKAAHCVIQHNEGHSGKADGQVGSGIFQRFRRCLQQLQNEGHGEKEKSSEYQGEGDEKGGGASHEAESFFFIFCAQGPGDGNGAADGEACNHDDDHVHHLAADGYAGNGGGAIVLAGNEKICHAVEGLEEAGCQIGNGKAHHFGKKGSPGKIILKYHSGFLIKKRQNILISKEYHVFFRK